MFYFARCRPKQFHQPITHTFTKCLLLPGDSVRLAEVRPMIWDFCSVFQVARTILYACWSGVVISLMAPTHTRDRTVSLSRTDMSWEVWPSIFARRPRPRHGPQQDAVPQAPRRRTAGFKTVMPTPDRSMVFGPMYRRPRRPQTNPSNRWTAHLFEGVPMPPGPPGLQQSTMSGRPTWAA